MNIEELKNRFETIANEDVDIATFIFDDLSVINKNRQKKYPVVLMTAPQSTITPFSSDFNTPIWENFKVTFHLLKTWTSEDKKTKSLDQVYRACDAIADKYLKNILAQGGNEYSLIGNKSVTKTREHHQHIDQLVGAQYDFTLRVFNSLCYGLDQPTNLTAAVTTDNQIDVTWTDNATSETGYEVWRSTDLINYSLAASIAANSTSYNDTGLTAGTIYHYKVRAFDANGGGIWSNIASKMCLAGIAYQKSQLTGQTTSYLTNDDGWNLANGVYDYTQPSNIIYPAQLDTIAASPFLTLKNNNAFGNTNRFTDDAGSQTYSNDYVIDHFTGLGWYRVLLGGGITTWADTIIAATASTQNGFTNWRIANVNEMISLANMELGFALNYAPFSAYDPIDNQFIWTSTTDSLNSNVAKLFESRRNAAIGFMITVNSKTYGRYYYLCRNHYA